LIFKYKNKMAEAGNEKKNKILDNQQIGSQDDNKERDTLDEPVSDTLVRNYTYFLKEKRFE